MMFLKNQLIFAQQIKFNWMEGYFQWFNLQNSINPFQFQQSSKIKYVKSNQNSISSIPKYLAQSKQQQSRSQLNYITLMDNMLPINEFSFNQNINRNSHNINEQIHEEMDPNVLSESFISSNEQSSQIQYQKKGLKNLSKLLIRTLKKNKIHSHKQLTQQVQYFLLKQKSLTKNECSKFSKNIRRRTYDALNVMISANVLDLDLQFTKKINISNKKKPIISTTEIPQIQRKMQEIYMRVQDKKQYLKELYKKKCSIQKLINKNYSVQKQVSHAYKNEYNALKQLHYNQQQKQTLQQKIQNQKRIIFPLVLCCSFDSQFADNIKFTGQDQIIIPYKNNGLKIFSEIDLLNNYLVGSQIDKKYLQLSEKNEKDQYLMQSQQQKIQIDNFSEQQGIFYK